ncbi:MULTISPECIES: hypothetical protein [Burkholderia cepacia complex]|uniref:hypothetical protein n=1 Tax=Burkholderia cepacia complex TaxID=87882 RepID=UPI000B10C7DA|nr:MULTISPECIES: hypothetical protein [Burkholderia cepacia complex]HDR9506736.1 hypothetical protein [Burkholderia cepacia]
MIDSLTALQRWYELSVRATHARFAGYGGPGNLPELLALAVEWIDLSATNDEGRSDR